MLHWGLVLWLDRTRPLEGLSGGGAGGGDTTDSSIYATYPSGGASTGAAGGYGGGVGVRADGQGQGLGSDSSLTTSPFETALEDLSQHHFSGSFRSGRALVHSVRQAARQGVLPGSRAGSCGILSSQSKP